MAVTDRAARALDRRLDLLRSWNAAKPPHGWVRAIRDALGMTTRQYARRLGVSHAQDAADEANTPLTPPEREGLLPTYITTRAELNAAEQENIAEADDWAFGGRRGSILDVGVLMTLHRRMFRRVWRWAGQVRKSKRNI